ncbi:hypothetical protein VC83_05168 [Pseudogymnoascus destructans]|uniref:Uncharacterized protein n=1 Tax=Pseudogymnoascus destructans TaxID=655981 RepID=A0A177ABX8_9PEZI|nr:uncharacterized protein VC83_05168 [Pseudogymnoascus destructans]OAF58684.1 hypothetical protein VC83_05168 [Pseudogymnoascus destructans]
MGTKNFEVNGRKDKGRADLTMTTTRTPRRVHLVAELKITQRRSRNNNMIDHKHTTEHSPNTRTRRTITKPSQANVRTNERQQQHDTTQQQHQSKRKQPSSNFLN